MKTEIKPIVVVPISTHQEVIERLVKAGYVVVPTYHPESVKVLLPQVQAEGGDLLMAAMFALADAAGNGGQTVRSAAVIELHRRMRERELEAGLVPRVVNQEVSPLTPAPAEA